MAQSTANLEGYTVLSSLSLAGSGATLKALDIIASTLSVSGSITDSGTTLSPSAIGFGSGAAIGPTAFFTSEKSLGFFRSAASNLALSYGAFDLPDGTAVAPSLTYTSDTSLGFFKSGASQVNLSYGWFTAPNFVSGTTLGASQTTASLKTQGAFYFSVNSLTTNGGEFGFRSGNTVYKFASIAAG